MVITLGVIVALAAWLTGSGRAAKRVLAGWTGGIGAVRTATGFDLGAVGAWVHRVKTWLNWTVVAVAVVILLVWSYPTAVVTIWIAVLALLALAVVEFLDDDGTPHLTGSSTDRSGLHRSPADDRPTGRAGPTTRWSWARSGRRPERHPETARLPVPLPPLPIAAPAVALTRPPRRQGPPTGVSGVSAHGIFSTESPDPPIE